VSAGLPVAIPVIQADIFTDRPFAGNPAAAVLGADGLDEATMRRVAAGMRTPGTAFVLAPARPDVDWRLRMFTPRREVGYSGHTALCGVHALIEAGWLRGDQVRFDTPSGLLRVEITRDDAGVLMWLQPPAPACRPFSGDVAPVLEALGLSRTALGTWARPAVTPDEDLLLPVRDLATLQGLDPDMRRLGALRAGQRARGVCVVSRQTVEPGSGTHCRFFAPHYGLPEDIVTGSVHSALGAWLVEAAALTVSDGRARFIAEQGDGLGRPGRLEVEVTADGARVSRVRVGGRAVTALSGSLRLGPAPP
jgi:trans-2,3-dihydro-3-hydroxyanthranilate isomerase